MPDPQTAADVLSRLPDQQEVDAIRRAHGFQKGKTRVELKAAAKPLTVVDEKKFRGQVWHRDRNRCRCCGRKVIKTLARVPERGEVHHCSGRTGWLRYEANGAILACLRCHERLTGRVSEKWKIEPVEPIWWLSTSSDGKRCIDARKNLKFVRVA